MANMEWITDRYPEDRVRVLVSLKYDDEAHYGLRIKSSNPMYAWDTWHIFGERELEYTYKDKDVDGWMPLPKSMYDSEAAFAEAMVGHGGEEVSK